MPTIPVLMIPGLNATPRAFEAQQETLWQLGPVTIANHREGSGMGGIAGAILRNAPPRFALGGFSMGGYVAFEIMRQAPERVVGLALIDTSARPDTPEAREKRRAAIELAKTGKFELAVANTFPNAVHPANVENAAFRALHREMARVTGVETYVRHQDAIMGRPDSRGDLATIKVPTVVIVGEADAITPIDAAREMADGIAGAGLAVISGAGHYALVEQPGQVNAALEGWLARIQASQ